MSSFIFCSSPSVSRCKLAVRLRSVIESFRSLTCDPVLSSDSAAWKRYASCSKCIRQRGLSAPASRGAQRTHILEVLPVQDGLFRLFLVTHQESPGRAHDRLGQGALDSGEFQLADQLARREGHAPERELVRFEGR